MSPGYFFGETGRQAGKYGEVLGLPYSELGQHENAANAFQHALRAEPDLRQEELMKMNDSSPSLAY